jgi:integrase
MASRRQKGSVILWKGKRGSVWRIKYADATGHAVMETIGPAKSDARPDGFTRSDVEAELRDRLNRVEKKRWEKPKPIVFRDYQATWFDREERLRHWKLSTVDVYRYVLARLTTHFGSMKLGEIRPRDVAAYVEEQSKLLGAATVNRDVGVLYDVMKTAKTEELIDSNPVEGANRPRIPKRNWRILKPEEIRRVANAFTDAQARVIFLMLVLTGLRKSELQRLRWRAVSLVESVLKVEDSKSESGERSIAIPSMLAEALAQHFQRTAFKGDDELVFCHPKRGTPYSKEIWTPLFAAALKAAGIKDHVRPFHDLRHTAITLDAASGASEIAVMTKAGHSSFATTRTYLHLAGTVFREEAERMERMALGGSSTEPSTDLSEPQGTEQDAAGLTARD